MKKIAVLIVTYNRLNCLKNVLKKYDSGNQKPSLILVVDNASLSDTSLFLQDWSLLPSSYLKKVIRIDKNEGSSMGFFVGINECMKYDFDWLFVSDDDAFPTEETIENLSQFIDSNDCDNYAAICSKVVNNNAIDVGHRRRIKVTHNNIESVPVPEQEYDNLYFDLNEFSYVGTAINKKAIEEYGSTRNDLYIFYDDTEHSIRLNKYGKIICVPSIEIIHNKPLKKERVTFQTFYYIRNRGLILKEYFGEKISNKFCFNIYLRNVFPLSAFLKRYTKKEVKLFKDAIFAVKNNIYGINSEYLSEWKK